MAAPHPPSELPDPTDPARLTPEDRLKEIAAIFAYGLIRLGHSATVLQLTVPAAGDPPPPTQPLDHCQELSPYGHRG